MSRQEIRKGTAVLQGQFLRHVEESHEHYVQDLRNTESTTYTSAPHSRFSTHSGQRKTQGSYPELGKNTLILISSFIRFTCILGAEVWSIINFWSYSAKCFYSISDCKNRALVSPLFKPWTKSLNPPTFSSPHGVKIVGWGDFIVS